MPLICTYLSQFNNVVQFLNYDDETPLVVLTPASSDVVRWLFAYAPNLVHVQTNDMLPDNYVNGEGEHLSFDPLDQRYAAFIQYGWEWLDIVIKDFDIDEFEPSLVNLDNMSVTDRNKFLNPHNVWVRFICGLCGIGSDVPKILVHEDQPKYIKDFDLEFMMVHSAEFRDLLLSQTIVALKKFGERPTGFEPLDFAPLYFKRQVEHIYDEIDPSDVIENFKEFVPDTSGSHLELDWDEMVMDRYTSVFNDPVRLRAKRHVGGEVSSVIDKMNEGLSQSDAMRWECNIFPASALVGLFALLKDKYSLEVTKMFDPMSGWGDRLFAAALSGVEYVGNDANLDMGTVYAHIMFGLAAMNELKLGMEKYSVNNQRIEDLNVDQHANSCQLAFTSPPYFSLEMYGDGDTAVDVSDMSSDETLEEYEKWKLSFGVSLIQKMKSTLQEGGILALHLSDFTINKVPIKFKRDFTKICLDEGLVQLDSWGYAYSRSDGKKPSVREFIMFRK